MARPDPIVTGLAASIMRVACHALHVALVFYGLLGWLVPDAGWLIAHLIFLPGLAIVWLFNDGVCPLNNLEAYLTTGAWRDDANPEEGAFLRMIVERYLGLHPTQSQMNAVTYGVMALAWVLSAGHLAAGESVNKLPA